jgi:hypothetical protein
MAASPVARARAADTAVGGVVSRLDTALSAAPDRC